jgi:citrate lyase subunit alpha/citrate CoA-transferase
MKNSLGRDIPEEIIRLSNNGLYRGAFSWQGRQIRAAVPSRTVCPGEKKLLGSLEEAIRLSGLQSGMTVSFHHHLRNGDKTLRLVLEEAERLGIRDLTVAASALFGCHGFLEDMVRRGVVSGIHANYISGGLAESISRGLLKKPVVMRTHGGRDRALEAGDLQVDVAFLAAPAADPYGNLNAVEGPAAFGSFGYAFADARYAGRVVALTDNLMPYPLARVSIDQTLVDYVVEVESIVPPPAYFPARRKSRGIDRPADRAADGGSHRPQRVFQGRIFLPDGCGRRISGGGHCIKEKMLSDGIHGSFGLGGITAPWWKSSATAVSRCLDTQCFDLGRRSNHPGEPEASRDLLLDLQQPAQQGAVVICLTWPFWAPPK